MPLRQPEKKSCLEFAKRRDEIVFNCVGTPEEGVKPQRFNVRAHDLCGLRKPPRLPIGPNFAAGERSSLVLNQSPESAESFAAGSFGSVMFAVASPAAFFVL
jgi:hypothetical protein